MTSPADRPAFIPGLGDVVHYVAHGSRDGRYPSTCRAATVSEVSGWLRDDVPEPDAVPPWDGAIRIVRQRFSATAARLLVVSPGGLFSGDGEPHPYDGTGVPGTWHRANECPHRMPSAPPPPGG